MVQTALVVVVGRGRHEIIQDAVQRNIVASVLQVMNSNMLEELNYELKH